MDGLVTMQRVAILAISGCLLTGCSLLGPSCENTAHIVVPNTTLGVQATVFDRNCGVGSEGNTQIAVSAIGENFAGVANVVILDDDHIEFFKTRPPVWRDGELVVTLPPGYRAKQSELLRRGTKISLVSTPKEASS